MLVYFAICFVMGVVTEAFAHWQKLWEYKHPMIRIGNMLFVFTLLFGLLSYYLHDNLVLAVIAGVVWGLIYEVVNIRWLHAWSFPGNPSWLKGNVAVYGVGVSWGAIVPIAVLLKHLLGV